MPASASWQPDIKEVRSTYQPDDGFLVLAMRFYQPIPTGEPTHEAQVSVWECRNSEIGASGIVSIGGDMSDARVVVVDNGHFSSVDAFATISPDRRELVLYAKDSALSYYDYGCGQGRASPSGEFATIDKTRSFYFFGSEPRAPKLRGIHLGYLDCLGKDGKIAVRFNWSDDTSGRIHWWVDGHRRRGGPSRGHVKGVASGGSMYRSIGRPPSLKTGRKYYLRLTVRDREGFVSRSAYKRRYFDEC